MEGGGAYGAGKATGHFDVLAYIKKPQVIVRAVSWVLAMIVFSCVGSSPNRYNVIPCIHDSENVYSLGISVGVIAFFGLMGFLVIDAVFDNLSSIQQRKYVVIADMAFSGFWAFMWLVCFSYMTNRCFEESTHAMYIAISASFFSILTFTGLTYLAVVKYRKGIQEDFGVYDYETNVTPGSTSISVPGITEDTFLPMPFSDGNTQKRDTGSSQGNHGQSQGDSFPPQGDCGLPQKDSNTPQKDNGEPQQKDVFSQPQYS